MPSYRHICALLLFALAAPSQADAQAALSSLGDATATATFESIGVIVPFEGDDDHDSRCTPTFRVAGGAWREGHVLWADHRTERRASREFRGSLVHLEPGTTYEVHIECTDPDGGDGSRDVMVTTWSETFPEGEVVTVSDGSETLVVNEGGTADAYRVYQPAPGQTATIDGGNAIQHTVRVNASYVILRGLTLTGPQRHGIVIEDDVHDVIIEDVEITDWGPAGNGRLDDWNWAHGSGVYAAGANARIVVQGCRIHHPRGGSNSWEDGPEPWQTGDHPKGPQAISFAQSAGNHVIRNNHCYSEGLDHYFNDIIGGSANGYEGNLYADSDVYGNVLSHAFDDGLEIEGFNMNIRIWGNVIYRTMKAIATANIGYNTSAESDNSLGPQYIWRNLIYDASPPYRTATKIRGYGGYYFFHNTILQSGDGIPGILESPSSWSTIDVTDVQLVGEVLNNILVSPRPLTESYSEDVADRWFFDHNLYSESRGSLTLEPDWESGGIFSATPVYDVQGDYEYYLASGSPGVDAATPIPNFNDAFSGAAPDMGAFERGGFPLPTGCEDGATRPCGAGACAGTETCAAGTWSSCDGPAPTLEICDNGADDDCDGAVDGADADCESGATLLAAFADAAPAIDGALGEFSAAAPLTFAAPAPGGGNQTTVRAIWDDEALTLAFEVSDDDVQTLAVTRDGDVWEHDGIELFLDVESDGGGALDADDVHLIVGAAGAIWDGRGTGEPGNFGDASWDADLSVANGSAAGGYVLEVRVPWADLGVTPQAQLRMGMLLVNNDLDADISRYSHNEASPWNVPSEWGALVLAPPPSAGADAGPIPLGDSSVSLDGGAADAGPPGMAMGGCSCEVGAAEAPNAAWLTLGLLALVGRRRRRTR